MSTIQTWEYKKDSNENEYSTPEISSCIYIRIKACFRYTNKEH